MIIKVRIVLLIMLLLPALLSGYFKLDILNEEDVTIAESRDLTLTIQMENKSYLIDEVEISVNIWLTNIASFRVQVPEAFDISNSLYFHLISNNITFYPLLLKAQPTNEFTILNPNDNITSSVNIKDYSYHDTKKELIELKDGDYIIQFYSSFTEPNVYSNKLDFTIKY